MSHALVKTNTQAALPAITTAEEMEVIKKQFFPHNATPTDIQYCMAVANRLGLNPLTKEVQFVGRRAKIKKEIPSSTPGNPPRIVEEWAEKIDPMVGRDGYLTIAHKTGQFAGIETNSTLKETPKMASNGEWSYIKTLVATSKVWRRDTEMPFCVEVSFHEYAQTTSEGKLTKFWAEKPDTMLKKVAESQALRKAFNIHGVYSAEEMGVGYVGEDGNIVTDHESQAVPRKPATIHAINPVAAQQQVADTVTADYEVMPQELAGGPLITTSQCAELERKIVEYEVDYAQFIGFMNVNNLSEITQSAFGTANAALESKRRQTEAAAKKAVQQAAQSTEASVEEDQAGLFSSSKSAASNMNDIVSALVGKNIHYELDDEGTVWVKLNYNDGANKEFVKGLGFKWDTSAKMWFWK